MAIDTPEHPGKPDRGYQAFMRSLGTVTPRSPGQTSSPSPQLIAMLVLAIVVAIWGYNVFRPQETEDILPVAPKQKIEVAVAAPVQAEVSRPMAKVERPMPTLPLVQVPTMSICEVAAPGIESFKVTRHPCMFDSPKGITVSMRGNAGFVYEAPTCKREDIAIGDPSVRIENGDTQSFRPHNGIHCWFVAMVAQDAQGWIDNPDKHVLVSALR